jgi:hypothetical protein
MWYKSPIFKKLIRDTIAILVGLAFLKVARPILALSPDIQQLLDLFYLDIRTDSAFRYMDYVNTGLEFLSFYSLPFVIAGFLAGFLGVREGGVLLGIMPAAFYSIIFVYLVPAIHIKNQAPASANNWLEWAVLYPLIYVLSGIIGGVIAWRLRYKIQSVRTHLRTTL